MSFTPGLAKHWFSTLGCAAMSGMENRQHAEGPSPGAAAAVSLEKPKIRSMSANRAQNVAQAGTIQINGNSDSLTQLVLDNARMWDCLCLIKSDPTVQCESAIRIIFSLDDGQFLTKSPGLPNEGTSSPDLKDSETVEIEKQRLMIENSRLHAILWVLRDNSGLQVDNTVAAVFRMDDDQLQEKFGMGFGYSPGCLSLLMKMGSKWKSCVGRRSPNANFSVSQLLRNNRSHSVASREMRSHVRRISDLRNIWSWKSTKFNTTGNWKATVPDDREPTRKTIQGNTIWLMPDGNYDVECGAELRLPSGKSGPADSSSVSGYPVPGQCDTNGNELTLGRTSTYAAHAHAPFCCSNNAVPAASKSREALLFRGYSKHFASYVSDLEDFHFQLHKAQAQSLLDRRDSSLEVFPSIVHDPNKHAESGEIRYPGQSAINFESDGKPFIAYSTKPAVVRAHGKPYPFGPYPTPKNFVEMHRGRKFKTGWTHPYKSDQTFCFAPGPLRKPNLEYGTIIGPIEAKCGDVMKRCDRRVKAEGEEGEDEDSRRSFGALLKTEQGDMAFGWHYQESRK